MKPGQEKEKSNSISIVPIKRRSRGLWVFGGRLEDKCGCWIGAVVFLSFLLSSPRMSSSLLLLKDDDDDEEEDDGDDVTAGLFFSNDMVVSVELD